MGEHQVRRIYLLSVAVTYLFAFTSLYPQIPGLYGDNGILPVKLALKPDARPLSQQLLERPTLMVLAPYVGLSPQHTLEMLTLLGVVLSFSAIAFERLRNSIIYAVLWLLYLSIYHVGQTFLWFQWDILLLEAGFLTIFVAPLSFLPIGSASTKLSKWKFSAAYETIPLWLLRWLLFRLMFASGVVKLTSLCPTWWGLTALNHHFESQCIPTPVAWFAHHLPPWILQLAVVLTYVIEIAVPFLFFAPTRKLRIFGFYTQVALQLTIILTGNYSFFNWLTITLSFSLLDDYHINWILRRNKGPGPSSTSLTRLLEVLTYGALTYATISLFSIQPKPDMTVTSKIAFTNAAFEQFVSVAVIGSIYMAVLSLFWTVASAISTSVLQPVPALRKVSDLLKTVLLGAVAVWIMSISMVPHTIVSNQVHHTVWPVIRKWHHAVHDYSLVNSYGLFRRMTGVGGRPEVIIEGSETQTGPWQEYHFLYKPGDISQVLPAVAPHQPRLDWQMWFAALGTYNHNPWFVSLVYRLLQGQPEVLDLLDKNRLPFPNAPPKFIRATQYTYSFTTPTSKTNDWWVRKKSAEYLPALSIDHQALTDFVKSQGLTDGQSWAPASVNKSLAQALTVIRQLVHPYSATVLIWSLLIASIALSRITGSRYPDTR